MGYRVVRSEEADRDLELIFDYLVGAYTTFGDPLSDAFERAVHRLGAIQNDMETLANAPYQGTLRPELRTGLRHVTKNQAVFYFEVDEASSTIRVLAVFYSRQDHVRSMNDRLGR